MIIQLLVAGHLLSGMPNPFLWLDDVHAKRIAAQEYRHKTRVEKKVYLKDGWVMTIQTDGFTGLVRCRLYSPKTLTQGRITFAQGVMGFELGHDASTADAWFAIDQNPAQPYPTLYPRLAELHVALEGTSLANPSGGVVLIPVQDLAEAKTIAIRVDEKSQPKRFKLKGFTQALASAKVNGCTKDDSFERQPW